MPNQRDLEGKVMAKKNCWEYKKCGREEGGANVSELGVCPVAQKNPEADGINNGKNAGRICWAVAGTLCSGEREGAFAKKQLTCLACDFFKTVYEEEGKNFYLLLPGQLYEPPKKEKEK